MKLLIIIFTILFLISSCAKIPIITTEVVRPAFYDAPSKLKRVLIMQSGDQQGFNISDDIEASLAGIIIHDMPYFTIVEKNEEAISRINRSNADKGKFDKNQLAKAGKYVGANGVYFQKITNVNVSDTRSSERRSECARYKQKKNKKGEYYDLLVANNILTIRLHA